MNGDEALKELNVKWVGAALAAEASRAAYRELEKNMKEGGEPRRAFEHLEKAMSDAVRAESRCPPEPNEEPYKGIDDRGRGPYTDRCRDLLDDVLIEPRAAALQAFVERVQFADRMASR